MAELLASVVVPVYNSPSLARCLEALAAQTLPAAAFEVLVVDNGGDQDLEPLVRKLPNARLLREGVPGSYAARNCGVRAARAPLLAFTDADCRPAPEWLAEALAALGAYPDGAVVAGRIDMVMIDGARPRAAELYDMIFCAFSQQAFVETQSFGVTANIVTTRAVLDRVGCFDATLRSGGDVEFCHRASKRGVPIVYAESLRVDHPARHSLRQLVKRQRRVHGGRFMLRGRRRELPAIVGAGLGGRFGTFFKLGGSLTAAGRQYGTIKLLGVLAIAVLLRLVEVHEEMRLRLGATPERE